MMGPVLAILYPFYRVLSWLRDWARRRFTPPGLTVLGALMVGATLAIDAESTVVYQALPLLLFLLLLAVAFSGFFRARFSATRLLPRFGTAGRPFRYRVLLRHLTRKPQSGLTLLEDFVPLRVSFRDWQAVQLAEGKRARSFRFSEQRRMNPFRPATTKEVAVPPLAPHQEAEVRVEITPLRRGALRFRGVTLGRSDPLGLFRSFVKVPLPQTALILPKRYLLPPIALPGTMRYQQGGVALASNIGQSEEFIALRDYRRGDPLRHIHWRSWAKTGRPIVKEFEDEFFVRHALVLDTFSVQPQSEAFEEAVSVVASFACAIQTQDSLLDLLFVGPQAYCFTVGRGLAHADQMLEILASVRACRDKPFETLAHLVLNHVNVMSGCICVLLAWNQERRELVEKLNALGVPVLVLVITEAGQGNLLEPGPLRQAPDRFYALEVGKIEQGLARLT